MVCVVGRMRDLILQLSKSSIYSTKPIEGLKNTKSAQMVLKPNDSTSVYKDYETEDDTTGGIYPDKGNGTSQPLHFQATLKQDGNIAIEPGDFKATSTFQVTYP